LEGLRDGPPLQCDYFTNSVVATLAHRQYYLSLRGMLPGRFGTGPAASPTFARRSGEYFNRQIRELAEAHHSGGAEPPTDLGKDPQSAQFQKIWLWHGACFLAWA